MRYTISGLAATTALVLAGQALAEVPRVVTDFAPAEGLVAMVMGDLGRPERLLEQGANPHDFQLRPSQAAALADADLVVWMGPQMAPWLNRALEGQGDLPQIRLLEIAGTYLQPFGATHAEDAHDHDAAPAADDHDGHDHEAHGADATGHEGHDDHGGHDHAGIDPHAWLDPGNGQVWLARIAKELAARDPENAATYAANAARAQADLAALDARLAADLAPLRGKPFVVFHDAYGYFTGHYGLTLAGAVAMGDATSPGAAHLAALRDKAGSQALCLFPESGHDPKLVEQMAEATGVALGAPLDPEGVQTPPGAGAYLAVLDSLGRALTECLDRS